ncbi:hypothetical protein RND71_027974 [Anisodus tanguticus]|uniref:Uncharacterized protein n=1 Tax=Anisodus tanguticus TaxID=243964 RepID=A0AAE1RIX3_9SOLA|nr:hypothetical protein RND71_027974 [Anisodus tanguticus]
MMASQEIVEQFHELISVRLPIIEAQRFRCRLRVYGKEFIAAATELMPECGVNRQLIELLSIRAPAPDVKMKLLKEIAEEHPARLGFNGAKVPLPKERFDEVQHSVSDQVYDKQTESDADFDSLDFPEVPKQQPLRHSTGGVSAPEMLPFPASALSDFDEDKAKPSEYESTTTQSTQPPSTTKTKDDIDVDLQDVLAAAQAAAAASLAQVRISELTRKRSEEVPVSPSENPFYAEKQEAHILEKLPLELQHQLSNSDGISSPLHGSPLESNNPSYDDLTVG